MHAKRMTLRFLLLDLQLRAKYFRPILLSSGYWNACQKISRDRVVGTSLPLIGDADLIPVPKETENPA